MFNTALSNDGVLRPLTADLLDLVEQNYLIATGRNPDRVICHPCVALKNIARFESTRWSALYWRSIPVVQDRRCPVNTLYMVCLDLYDDVDSVDSVANAPVILTDVDAFVLPG